MLFLSLPRKRDESSWFVLALRWKAALRRAESRVVKLRCAFGCLLRREMAPLSAVKLLFLDFCPSSTAKKPRNALKKTHNSIISASVLLSCCRSDVSFSLVLTFGCPIYRAHSDPSHPFSPSRCPCFPVNVTFSLTSITPSPRPPCPFVLPILSRSLVSPCLSAHHRHTPRGGCRVICYPCVVVFFFFWNAN